MLVGALLCLVGCSGPSTRSGGWQSVALGVCEDYPEETRTLEKARSDLAFARDSGATVLRVAFGWDAMEPERGKYDWSFWDEFVRMATQEFRLTLIPYVCYTPKWAAKDSGDNFWRSPPRDPGDFGQFMAAIVTRYRHAIHSWELWNEPDNQAYWLGSLEEFAALVREGSKAVRGADRSALVVLGGIATELSFLERLFRTERIAPFVDVVNLHTYFETWHPDPIEQLPPYLRRAADIVRTFGEREPLWMAEAGYSSVGARSRVSDVYHARWRGEHTEDAQAAAVARIAMLALGSELISTFAWYRINDLEPAQNVIGDDNNRHLGLRRFSGEPKPATDAFAQLVQRLRQPFRHLPLTVETLERGPTEPVVVGFLLRDGRCVLAAWLATDPDNESSKPVEPADDNRHARIRVQLPFRARTLEATSAAGRRWPQDTGPLTKQRSNELIIALRGSELVVITAGR